MGERTERHFDCDRCDATWVGRQGDQPPGWTAWKYTSPPLAVFDDSDTRLILCGKCHSRLVAFLDAPATQPEAADA